MAKIKFNIQGMHCQSCAALIEEKLKNHQGILKLKVNYDSGKAVVIYDDQTIQEPEIGSLIEGVGDYQVEKIEEKEESTDEDKEFLSQGQRTLDSFSNKISATLRILTSLVIISLGLNVALLIVLFKSSPQELNLGGQKATAAIGQNVPSQNQPPQNQPNTDVALPLVSFEIKTTDHIRGNVSAPVTLVEFSDFECPFCERIYPTLKQVLANYADKVRLVYKYFPLSFHPNAQKAAEAAECASEQGKFWEYHDKLFENQAAGFSTDKFKQWAGELNLSNSQFNECLDSGKYAQKVQADFQEGTKKGVSGTPTTFVNGQLVVGAQSYETFKQTIDKLLSDL